MAGMADRIVEARKAMKRAVLEAWGKLREDMLAQVDRFVRSLE